MPVVGVCAVNDYRDMGHLILSLSLFLCQTFILARLLHEWIRCFLLESTVFIDLSWRVTFAPLLSWVTMVKNEEDENDSMTVLHIYCSRLMLFYTQTCKRAKILHRQVVSMTASYLHHAHISQYTVKRYKYCRLNEGNVPGKLTNNVGSALDQLLYIIQQKRVQWF